MSPAGVQQFEPLSRPFYTRGTVTVAKELLGKMLIRQTRSGRMVGQIVEVEAYGGSDDPASHACHGPTSRNRVMFGLGGFAYVYFTYGMHYCFNVTTAPENVPGAVLIRAAQPLEGVELMMKNRKVANLSDLANGPAKLTQAFQIGRKQNGIDLTACGELFIADNLGTTSVETVSSARIGVTDRRRWRFFIKGNSRVAHLRGATDSK